MALPDLGFSLPARQWFEANFAAPTPVQNEGWTRIAAGEHALLIAPTGSGKTLAAFFYCIDRLAREAPRAPSEDEPGVRVLYVSPLKALVYDIERNLRAPLVGIRARRRRAGEASAPPAPRVAVRTGDTPQKRPARPGPDPAEILVTTPESLYLILGSAAARHAALTVETVIVDEIHALAPTKRGAHLALSLERVAHAALRAATPSASGLSATATAAGGRWAAFLGGDRAGRGGGRQRARRGIDLDRVGAGPRHDAARGLPGPGDRAAWRREPTTRTRLAAAGRRRRSG